MNDVRVLRVCFKPAFIDSHFHTLPCNVMTLYLLQVGHIDEDGRDLNPLAEGYTESRCIGERFQSPIL